jgi:hypothetical protein
MIVLGRSFTLINRAIEWSWSLFYSSDQCVCKTSLLLEEYSRSISLLEDSLMEVVAIVNVEVPSSQFRDFHVISSNGCCHA